MNKDDIVRIYMQVSDELCDGKEWCWHGVGEPLQLFAALVAAAEREACAKLVDPSIDQITYPNDYIGGKEGIELLENIAQEIRSRGNT